MSSNGNTDDGILLTSNAGDFGVRDDGSFRRKDVGDIQDALLDIAKEEFGESVDLAPGSPHRQLIDVATIELADIWNSLEGTYYATYLEDSFGVQLDKILALAGVSRIPRRGSTGEVTFTTEVPNSEDATIPRGTEVTTERTEESPRIPFKTAQPAILPAGETSVERIPIKALEPWETSIDDQYLGEDTNVPAGTITRIATPIAGVRDVTNPLPTGTSGERDPDSGTGETFNFVVGRDRETDPELRNRYRNSLATAGTATLGAIRSAVANADPTVRAATIEENNTMVDETASGGLPPKSVRVIVLGGIGSNIAQTLVDTRSGGIETYGDESAIGEVAGDEYVEYWSWAEEVDIYVHVDVSVEDTFPSDGETRIRDNIIRYLGGVTSDETRFAGTDIGADVMYDIVFGAIMNVRGTYAADLQIGTVPGALGVSDITIESDQISWVDDTDISINTTFGEIP